ncbi:PaaX family transcriptional regulator C-terminal domain-containing protein [Microbacterium sp. ET2]|uniref:PaaX family transcriptional regulator n=1 Tax=Microbacterium albipurpureum TaxID=3050384 RepID=UPI00259CCD26|nr:PaaX family transcriptional regulator C-terminal domain-containing protein [Microbacterium sp. ET2 (Ac-2212)]WJL94384.1 PaaX family transcriptional regulator C-terminal domain-containing protein [Microbacterium sp. ET2 (Ac-2212)]
MALAPSSAGVSPSSGVAAAGAGSSRPLRKVSPARQVLTLFGDYWWRNDAPLPSAALVGAMGDLGMKEPAARATLARLVRLELLEQHRDGRRTTHGLTARGRAIIEDEAAWLESFGVAPIVWDGAWSVVTFSIPEAQRALRHTARSRLKFLGFGPLYDGVWISPSDVAALARAELLALGVPDVTTMRAQLDVAGPGGPQRAWDLAGVGERYGVFRRELVASTAELTGAAALAERTGLMIHWQAFRGVDAGLPAALLPPDWPREEIRGRFGRRFDELGPAAEERMRWHVSRVDEALAWGVLERRLSR